MAFEPKTWADGKDGGTPITAAELNRLEQGLESASQPPAAPAWEDVTGKPATFPAADPAWADVTGKPASFPPADHKHDAADIDSGTLAAARIPTLSQSKVTGLAALVTRIEALEQKVEALEPEA